MIAAPADIRLSTIGEFRAAAGPLLLQHWQEIALHKELMVLDPHWERYEALDDAGVLLLLGAWVGDQMVGYSLNFVTEHLHYSGLTYSQNDVLFVAPTHRGIGKQLIAETERMAKERGAKMQLWHAKEGSTLDRMLKHSEHYGVQDITYSRIL